jgi:ELWxxDGT repeat protein
MSRSSSLGTFGFGFVALLLPALAAAQPATILLDINTDSDPGSQAASFRSLRAAGDRLYFDIGPGDEDRDLWVSDGTASGTEVLRDLCSTPCGRTPRLLGAIGNRMFWTAESALRQKQLWSSNGTRSGTFALTGPEVDVWSGVALSRSFFFVGCSPHGEDYGCDLWQTDGSVAGTRVIQSLTSLAELHGVGDRLYYVTVSAQGADLWVTDGTVGGAVKLHRFGDAQVGPRALATVGDRLFFLATEGGEEVWSSDGTVAGTRAVTSFAPERPFATPPWLKPISNRVYFVADDGLHGRELWRTDGTAAGTLRLTELVEKDPFPFWEPTFLVEVGGTVVFATRDGLWTTRGTPGSTAPLPLPCGHCEIDMRTGTGLVESGGKVFFLLREGSRLGLWITDGGAAGTRRIRDLCEGTSCAGDLRAWKGGVLLVVETREQKEIWLSDGTAGGTRPFTHLTGARVADPVETAEVGGDLFFLAEGQSQGLWVRDGEGGKTRPVYTLPAAGSGSTPSLLTAFREKLLFRASDGSGSRLWSSAGTAETTIPVDLPGIEWSEIQDLLPAAGVIFFQVRGDDGVYKLWRTDGTAQGTVQLAELPARAVMVVYQDRLYSFAGREMWVSDGTVAGTVKAGGLPEDLPEVAAAASGPNGIYLQAITAPFGTDFWFTGGNPAELRQLASFPGLYPQPPGFTPAGPWMYFIWDRRLWRTDGTAAGTVALEGLPAGEAPEELISDGTALYVFTSSTAVYDVQLWRMDGTAADMVRLAVFPFIPFGHLLRFYLESKLFAGKLFFSIDDGAHGVELWETDGTPAGTRMVRDLFPRGYSSVPGWLTAAGGRLFFSARDDVNGFELWETDGTAAGTRLVQDIAPHSASSYPGGLTAVGDRLFFAADDGLTGREVWTLPLSGSTACRASSTRLCLGGGRYAVEATWRDFQGNRGVGHAAPLTADTGYFWFFDPANVETVLKVLDGRGVNGHVWVFYGALSNVEYALTVTDTQTGFARRYLNPAGQFSSVGDTTAFGPLEDSATVTAAVAPPPRISRRAGRAEAVCAPSSTRLCLNGDRFAVEIAWKDFQGKTGVGQAVEITADTGYFWFFDPANVELALKILDGTPVNGHRWVFYGALSSVEYTVTVTDTQTGETNTYRNPSGQLASVADTEAF